MDLAQKGGQAYMAEDFKQLAVIMSWQTAADFDLAAVVESENGTKDMVYFGKKGDLNAYPFVSLDKDAGVGDTSGANKETLRISKMDGKKKIHVIAWDYGKINSGEPARFAGSDVRLMVQDDNGKRHDVKLDCGEAGNVALIATIDLSDMMGPKLINASRAGVLKGLKRLEDITTVLGI